jgi:hypothetical protein
MAKTCSDREVRQDNKLHLRWKYMYISKEFLHYESLLETTKIIDVLEMVKIFSQTKLDWKDTLHTLGSAGAPAMLSNTPGCATVVKNEDPYVVVTHCFLHRYALATNTLSITLKEVLLAATAYLRLAVRLKHGVLPTP